MLSFYYYKKTYCLIVSLLCRFIYMSEETELKSKISVFDTLYPVQSHIDDALTKLIKFMISIRWLETGIVEQTEYELVISNVEFGETFPGRVPAIPQGDTDETNDLEYDPDTNAIRYYGMPVRSPTGRGKLLWQSLLNLLAASYNLDQFYTYD